MVQEFMILRCFSCATFQVHQVKKSKKWMCKVCGEKQSIKKVFVQGSGQDCCKQVQHLNMNCGAARQAKDWTFVEDESWDSLENTAITVDDDQDNDNLSADDENSLKLTTGESKWDRFFQPVENKVFEDWLQDEFDVTTDRNKFDDASSKRKRKPRKGIDKDLPQKRLRNDARENHAHCHAGDKYMYQNEENNVTGTNQFSSKGNSYVSKSRTQVQSLPIISSNGASSKGTYTEFQSTRYSDTSNSYVASQKQPQALSNLHFAKATRDAITATTIQAPGKAEQHQQVSAKNSKWAKFMCVPCLPNSSQEESCNDDVHESFDDEVHDFKFTSDAEQQDERQSEKCKALRIANDVAESKRQMKMVQLQDLFKVDDDLDEEWWDLQ